MNSSITGKGSDMDKSEAAKWAPKLSFLENYLLVSGLLLVVPSCAPIAHHTALSPYQWTVSKPADGSVTVRAPAGVGTPDIEHIFLRARIAGGRIVETKSKYDFQRPFE